MVNRPVFIVFVFCLLCPALGTGCGDDDGGSHTNPYCDGEPTRCPEIEVSVCTGQSGCRVSDVCRGTPAECSTFDSQPVCESQAGCAWGEGCAGTPDRCDTMGDQWACEAQSGCFWMDSYCAGAADACISFSDDWSCGYQTGCEWVVWGDYCDGATGECRYRSDDLCEYRTGCVLEQICSGLERPCRDFRTLSECEAQAGCAWVQ